MVVNGFESRPAPHLLAASGDAGVYRNTGPCGFFEHDLFEFPVHPIRYRQHILSAADQIGSGSKLAFGFQATASLTVSKCKPVPRSYRAVRDMEFLL